MIWQQNVLWSLQNSNLTSQRFGIILADSHVRVSNVPFQSFILLYTAKLWPIRILKTEKWPMKPEENQFEIVWGEPWQQWQEYSSKLNQDPFPAWSSHSRLLNCQWSFDLYERLNDRQMTHEMSGNSRSRLGNEMWDVDCRPALHAECCSAELLQSCRTREMCSCHLSLRWWAQRWGKWLEIPAAVAIINGCHHFYDLSFWIKKAGRWAGLDEKSLCVTPGQQLRGYLL